MRTAWCRTNTATDLGPAPSMGEQAVAQLQNKGRVGVLGRGRSPYAQPYNACLPGGCAKLCALCEADGVAGHPHRRMKCRGDRLELWGGREEKSQTLKRRRGCIAVGRCNGE